MNKFLVELYIWKNSGLTVTKHKFNSGREAMDFAYGKADWNVIKIYNNEDVLIHGNSTNKEYESYA